MNFTITNSQDWLPHFTMDYDTCLWSGLHDKLSWDVNWVSSLCDISGGGGANLLHKIESS